MENNKYYTPTLNDFAEGLKYEWKFTSEGYTPFIHSFKFILPELQNIRVKYLDREDIESLGWIYDVNMSESKYASFYIEPGYDNKNRFIQYSLQNYGNGKVYLDKCINSGVHEIGFLTIKNKSELIKLMQQLNINNNVKEF